MSKVKIRKVVENPGHGPPILLDFEHAGVNKHVDVSTRLVAGVYESDNLVNASTHKNSTRKRKQVVVVQGETDMTYIGSSDGVLNADTGLRTYLAIRHKKKLKIYEATPLTVSPYLGNRAHLQVIDEKAPMDKEDKRKAAIDLIKAFGSKQKRLAHERKERNIINSEHMNESINTATATAQVPETSPTQPVDTSLLALIPPCNRSTKDLKEVYSLQDILTAGDMAELTDTTINWLNATSEQVKAWKISKQFSDYFFEMHRRLQIRKDEPKGIYTAKIVIYTELLICLMKLRASDFRKKIIPLPSEFPVNLVDKAVGEFTIVNANKIRCRSDAYKDKTCCYIMVLVLLANEFIFDVQLLSTSLQIHIKKLLTLARAVGITTTFNSSTKEYKGLLKLPLPKQIEGRGRRKLRK